MMGVIQRFRKEIKDTIPLILSALDSLSASQFSSHTLYKRTHLVLRSNELIRKNVFEDKNLNSLKLLIQIMQDLFGRIPHLLYPHLLYLGLQGLNPMILLYGKFKENR